MDLNSHSIAHQQIYHLILMGDARRMARDEA